MITDAGVWERAVTDGMYHKARVPEKTEEVPVCRPECCVAEYRENTP